MDQGNWPETDLWGQPGKAPADPRGRKRHKRMPLIAENVAVLRAGKASVEDIAVQVGLSVPTLKKYYFRELRDGAKMARLELNRIMWQRAKQGVVGAARFLREEFSTYEEPVDEVPLEETPAKLGKKEEAQLAADKVGGKYATPPSPKLVYSKAP